MTSKARTLLFAAPLLALGLLAPGVSTGGPPAGAAPPSSAPAGAASPAVAGFLRSHCTCCHGPQKSKVNLAFHTWGDEITAGPEAEQWARVLRVLERGEMPPEDEPQPAPADRAAAAALPKRMLVTYFAYGAYMPGAETGVPRKAAAAAPHPEWSWWPCRDPGPLTFNQSSAPFEPLKGYVSYLRGLDHTGGQKLGGHSSGDVFATGADMVSAQKTNAISVDQVAAGRLGHQTRLASLVLGTEGGTGSYGQAKTLSHRGPARPIPSLHRPQEIFNRLFKPYGGAAVADVRARLKREASILDSMLDHGRSLKADLGREDQAKLDEYLESVRAIEQRVERTSRWTHEPLPDVDTKGLDVEVSHKQPREFIRCMYDLVYLAFRTDSTRFATLMLESESSQDSEMWNYANYALGYKGATHDIAHKRPPDFAGRWDRWRAEQHAYFLQRLRDTPEGDGNLLDRTVVLWGSAHPHASHSTANYPIHLAGGNHLGLRHGKLYAFEGGQKVPLANLFVTMLNAVDVPVRAFADSTGPLTDLTA